MIIRFVKFKETKESDWKAGVIVQGSFETTLIDSFGRVVKNVFDAEETGVHLNYAPIENN